jgi:hypothetical protein
MSRSAAHPPSPQGGPSIGRWASTESARVSGGCLGCGSQESRVDGTPVGENPPLFRGFRRKRGTGRLGRRKLRLQDYARILGPFKLGNSHRHKNRRSKASAAGHGSFGQSDRHPTAFALPFADRWIRSVHRGTEDEGTVSVQGFCRRPRWCPESSTGTCQVRRRASRVARPSIST